MPNEGQSSHVAAPPEAVREQRPVRSQTPIWIVALLLAFIAGLLWNRGSIWTPSAIAQQPPMAGARGVYAFTGQIDESRYGLFMLDIEQGTVWCYEMEGSGSKRMLKLTAARTWIYDRYLRDFNCAEPNFRQVQELVGRQRAAPSPDSDGVRQATTPDSSRDGGREQKKPRADGSPGDSE